MVAIKRLSARDRARLRSALETVQHLDLRPTIPIQRQKTGPPRAWDWQTVCSTEALQPRSRWRKVQCEINNPSGGYSGKRQEILTDK